MSNQSSLLTPLTPAREKHFNTAGRNIAILHYELDPLVRECAGRTSGLENKSDEILMRAARGALILEMGEAYAGQPREDRKRPPICGDAWLSACIR